MRIILSFVSFFFLFSCNEFSSDSAGSEETGKGRKLPSKMIYSYDCLKSDSGKVSEIWGKADNLVTKVATFNIEVSDDEQMRFGDSFLIESLKDKNFAIDSVSPVNNKLKTIVNNLVKERVKATDIQYSIYLLNDTATINAYTVGGKIFITTAMLNKCKNDDQLYAIIGHEIGHNEKGHIKVNH
jgi:hypothetical protein